MVSLKTYNLPGLVQTAKKLSGKGLQGRNVCTNDPQLSPEIHLPCLFCGGHPAHLPMENITGYCSHSDHSQSISTMHIPSPQTLPLSRSGVPSFGFCSLPILRRWEQSLCIQVQSSKLSSVGPAVPKATEPSREDVLMWPCDV